MGIVRPAIVEALLPLDNLEDGVVAADDRPALVVFVWSFTVTNPGKSLWVGIVPPHCVSGVTVLASGSGAVSGRAICHGSATRTVGASIDVQGTGRSAAYAGKSVAIDVSVETWDDVLSRPVQDHDDDNAVGPSRSPQCSDVSLEPANPTFNRMTGRWTISPALTGPRKNRAGVSVQAASTAFLPSLKTFVVLDAGGYTFPTKGLVGDLWGPERRLDWSGSMLQTLAYIYTGGEGEQPACAFRVDPIAVDGG